MGLNLSLNRVQPGERYGTRVDTFDSARFAGDREFESYCLGQHGLPHTQNFTERPDPEFAGWGDVPVIYWRPTSLHAAEWWVRSHIYVGNQPRLLEAFEMMRVDEALYFYSSW